jgi:hypothetical protein
VECKASEPKRKKTVSEDGLYKPSALTAKPFSTPKPRLSSSTVFTPRPDATAIKNSVEPTITSSAPAAAGRSPTRSKRSGILSSRRTRLNAPVFGSRSHAPLSLAAAVNGTLGSKKHKSRVDTATLEESKPKAWFFDIYEEPAEQQDFTVSEWTMTQSACTLDISDDERKTPAAREDKGKENIPPSELHTAAAAGHTISATTIPTPASRKDLMTEEPRTPLGDLNPSDYYATGCDATSIIVVEEDTTEPEKPAADDLINAQSPSSDFNFHIELPAPEEQDRTMTKSELHDLLLDVAPAPSAEQHDVEAGLFGQANDADDNNVEEAEPADIEIWESGSAKDEAGEVETAENIFAEL